MKVTTRSMRFKFNLTFSTIRWSLCILIVRGFHASHFSFSKPRTGEVLLFVNCNNYLQDESIRYFIGSEHSAEIYAGESDKGHPTNW